MHTLPHTYKWRCECISMQSSSHACTNTTRCCSQPQWCWRREVISATYEREVFRYCFNSLQMCTTVRGWASQWEGTSCEVLRGVRAWPGPLRHHRHQPPPPGYFYRLAAEGVSPSSKQWKMIFAWHLAGLTGSLTTEANCWCEIAPRTEWQIACGGNWYFVRMSLFCMKPSFISTLIKEPLEFSPAQLLYCHYRLAFPCRPFINWRAPTE